MIRTKPGRSKPESGAGFLRLADVVQRSGDGEEADGKVDEECPAPRQIRREEATQQGAHRRHAADDRPPDAEGDGAVPALEVGVEDRLGGGQDHRPADALQDPREDQDVAVRSKPGEHRGQHEDHQAREVHPATTQDVAHASDRDEQGSEDERVDRVDPLRLRRVQVQVADDRGDRDVHDRRVDDDHRDADAQHREADPAAAARGVHGGAVRRTAPEGHRDLLLRRRVAVTIA